MASESKSLKAGDDLGNGWSVYHAQEPEVVQSGGNSVLVNKGGLIAHRREGSTMVEAYGKNAEDLKRAIEAHGGGIEPNPNREDGNRELSDKETLESAKGTTIMQVTADARVSRQADLTPAGEQPKPKAAIIHAKPPLEEEKLGEEDAAGVHAVSERAERNA